MPKTRRQKRRRQQQRKTQRGGSYFDVPIRSFYPQNQYTVDPQRMAIVGGKRRKNHSRKYLRKSGGGFFSNFGTTSGALSNATAVTGYSPSSPVIGQRFLV
jgi:hypothetical protein